MTTLKDLRDDVAYSYSKLCAALPDEVLPLLDSYVKALLEHERFNAQQPKAEPRVFGGNSFKGGL